MARKGTIKDKGWAWMVVLGSFLGCSIMGLLFSGFSILYVAFAEYFVSDKATAGWIGSLHLACAHTLAFLFGALVERFGCRGVAALGAMLGSVGYVASTFATNIPTLYVTYGLIAGTGTGMLFFSGLIIVQQYFDKKRAFAGGLSGLGVSVGGLLAGPFLTWLIDSYGWRGTLLIIGGLHLNGLVCAALYRPFVEHGKAIDVAQDDPPMLRSQEIQMKILTEDTDPTTEKETPQVVKRKGLDLMKALNFSLLAESVFCFAWPPLGYLWVQSQCTLHTK